MKRYQAVCDCGFTGVYKTEPVAVYALSRHACEATRKRQERAARVAARKAPGVKRDCTHKYADHTHGTYAAFVLDGCRCADCREAKRVYELHRRQQIAYGRWEPYTDAEPVRAHLRTLMDAGMGLKRIAEVSGISSGSLTKIVYGITNPDGSHRPPARKVRHETARRLLDTRLDLADGAKVDGTGTRRRLQALVALGYPQAYLQERIGHQNLNRVIHGGGAGKVYLATHKAVTALYDELSMRLPAPVGRKEREASTRARTIARRHGWLPPLAWDDELLDDPDATPATGGDPGEDGLDHAAIKRRMAGDKTVRLTKAEKTALVDRWAATGRSLNECERVTGIPPHRYRNAAA